MLAVVVSIHLWTFINFENYDKKLPCVYIVNNKMKIFTMTKVFTPTQEVFKAKEISSLGGSLPMMANLPYLQE